ncbi:hypothetical protein XAUC_10710 [Xanthomonas citri pv. aurantifolii str. ICPB 10535]|nr:hypothetical protein XAUC_10710 [Xanthomonas citri pv. aurantifolii str. ICPB 10535]
MPVEQDLPGLGFVKTRNQFDQTGFAAPGTPDDGGDGARLRNEADIGQCRIDLAGVARRDIAKFDQTLGTRQRHGTLIRLVRAVEHRKQTLGRCQAALHHVLHIGQLLEARNDRQHRGHQHDEIAGRQSPGQGLRTGHEQQCRQADRADHLHGGSGNAAGGFDLHRQAQVAIGQRAIALHFGLLSPVDLDLLMAGQGLVGGLQQLRTAFLDAVADTPVAPRHLVHHPGQHRGKHQDGQCHLPAMPQHQRKRTDHLQRLLDHDLDRIHCGLRNLVRIRAQAYQHRRHRLRIEA